MVHVTLLGPLMVQQFLQFKGRICSDIVPFLERSVDIFRVVGSGISVIALTFVSLGLHPCVM